MSKYHLRITRKTRLLNFFRRLFTIRIFEQILVRLIRNNSSKLLAKLIPPEYLYKKEAFRNVTRNKINYKLDISNVVDHYFYYGIEDLSYASVKEELKTAKVILDIGANIGTTALHFASINSGALVLAFEPHPTTYKRAEENIKLNSLTNIHLINIGLGKKREILKLYEVNEHNPGMNRIITENRDLPFKEIKVDTLDNIMVERNISTADFIKIDVEGYEYSVLLGSIDIISKSKPTLFIELNDDNLKDNNSSAKDLIDLLISLGYTRICRADNLNPITIDTKFNDCHYDIIAKQ